MTVRCPVCNEWLIPTESGAVCFDRSHGGVFGGVTEKHIEAAKKSEARQELKLERQAKLIEIERVKLTIPKAHRLGNSTYWRIEWVAGIFTKGYRCAANANPEHSETIADTGSAYYRFVHAVQFESDARKALGIDQ